MLPQRISNNKLAFGRNTPAFIIDAFRKTGVNEAEFSHYEVAVIKANPCGLKGQFRVNWSAGSGYAIPEFNGTNHYGIVTFTRRANVQQALFEEDESL